MIFLLILVVVAAACGGEQVVVVVTPTPDVQATIQAGVATAIAEELETIPTPTPVPTPTPTQTPEPPTPTPRPPTPTPIPTPSLILADIVEAIKPDVVRIITPDGQGTGFIYNEAGFILTNAHVVGTYSSVTVVLEGTVQLTGSVLGRDDIRDLAVVKIPSTRNYTTATLGDSDRLRVGEEVVVIGFALGSLLIGEPSVTRGIVSAKERLVEGVTFIQTDAPINPGNSGGPLINLRGEVVGINSAKFESAFGRPVEAIGLAIPINQVIPKLVSLEAGAIVVSATPTPIPSVPAPSGYLTLDYGDTYGLEVSIPNDWIWQETERSAELLFIEYESPDQAVYGQVQAVLGWSFYSYTVNDLLNTWIDANIAFRPDLQIDPLQDPGWTPPLIGGDTYYTYSLSGGFTALGFIRLVITDQWGYILVFEAEESTFYDYADILDNVVFSFAVYYGS